MEIPDGTNEYIEPQPCATGAVPCAAPAASAPGAKDMAQIYEDKKLEAFKKAIWEEINSYPFAPGGHCSIQISDAAFRKMMADPTFRNQVLSLIKEDAAYSNFCRDDDLYIFVDENGYHAYSSASGSGRSERKRDEEAKERAEERKARDKAYYKKLYEKKLLEKKWLQGLYRRRELEQQHYEKLLSDRKRNYAEASSEMMSRSAQSYENLFLYGNGPGH